MTRYLLPTPQMGRSSLTGVEGPGTPASTSVMKTLTLSWEVTWDAKGNAPGYVLDLDSRYGITMDGSNRVSDWAERYSNGMVFSQSTDSQKPVFTTNRLGTVPSLVFNGATNNRVLVGNTAAKDLIRNNNAYTCYAIWRFNDQGNKYVLWATTNSNSGGRFVFGQGAGSNGPSNCVFIGGRVGDTGSAYNLGGNKAQTPNFQFSTGIYNANTQIWSVFLNNVLATKKSSILTSGSIPNTAAFSTHIGAQAPDGSSGQFNGDLIRMIVCTGEHTAAQRAAMWKGILFDYRNETGFYAALTTVQTPDLIVQLHGDSNTQGNARDVGDKTLSDCLWDAYGGVNTVGVINAGETGATGTSLNTNVAATVNTLTGGEATKEVIVLTVGVNDASAGASGATIYSRVQTLAASYKAANSGRKVVCCTYPAWGGGTLGQRTALKDFNDLLLAESDSNIDAVCHLGGITECLNDGTNSAASNTTYYNTDKLHWKVALYQLIAAAMKTTIDSV